MDRRAFIRMLSAAGVTVGLAGPGPLAGAARATTATSATSAATAASTPGAHQPSMHGYNAAQIKNWSPATDPLARYFRSRVPLAPRIAPFAATQANPALATGPQLMNLSYDYDNSFFTAFKYNDVYARRILRFWQYTDLYGSWHGLPVDGASPSSPEFGVVNAPNPAWTDAAHRNGAKSLGCWFWPRSGTFSDYLEKRGNGSFPVADKLTEMAVYFGFDGYFVNQEASLSPADAGRLMEMLTYWRRTAPAGFHLQWYDTLMVNGQLSYQNGLNSSNAPWIQNAGTPVSNSLFANYWITQARVDTSRTTALNLGLDPYQVAFHGTENEQYGFNPPYDPRLVFPEGAPAKTSWAVFGSHFVWERYLDRDNPDAQGAVFTRERQYWSGPNEDPTRTGRTEYAPRAATGQADDADDPQKWDGVARYVTERSAIGKLPFVTRFNTGHGRSFFRDGQSTSSREWNHLGIQDLLPTWQFWARSAGTGAPLAVDFDYATAFDGGSSLRVSGPLGPDNPTTARLFKTHIVLNGTEKLTVRYTTGRADEESGLDVGLVFEDAPDAFVWLPAGRTTSAGWNTMTSALGAHSGRTVAAIALRASSATARDYTLNVGELALLPGSSGSAPAAPTGFTVEAVYQAGTTAEVFLAWNFATSGVWYYDVTRDGEWLGRIYDEVYYIKELTRRGTETESVLRLEAVAPDGTRSAPATATVPWGPSTPVETNLALNRPATASGQANANEGPAKAVNGSVSGGNSDKWCTLTTTTWLEVDLGSARTLSKFVVKHAAAGGESALWNTRDFTIQTRTTTSAPWSTAVTVTANTAAVTTHPVTVTTRYVRLVITKPTQNTDPAARIYEFEAWGV